MEKITNKDTINNIEYGYLYGHKCKILERYKNNQVLVEFNNITFLEFDMFIESQQPDFISDDDLKKYINLYRAEIITSSYTFTNNQVIFLLENLISSNEKRLLIKFYINDFSLEEINLILNVSINEYILNFRKFDNNFLDKNFDKFSGNTDTLIINQHLEEWFIKKYIDKLNIKFILQYQKHLSEKFKEQLKIIQKFKKEEIPNV